MGPFTRRNLSRQGGAPSFSRGLIPFFLLMALVGCADESGKTIRLGYVGGLTGRVADLGTAGRDGVILAVEEANASGGVGGRMVELLVEDDGQDPELARKAVQRLLDKDVIAIIGHMTSAMSVATVPLVNEAGVVMMSPTTSTNELTGKDDYFYRVYPSGRQASELLARHIYETRGLRRMAVVYDLRNKAYTETMFQTFRNAFEALGGQISFVETYTSGPDVVFSDIAQRVFKSPSDGLFLVANAMDTGLFCQRLRHTGSKLPVFTGEWSGTEEILHFGADAVEGIEFLHTFDKNGQQPAFLAFCDEFSKRFGYQPGFASVHGYDATRIILGALADPRHQDKLKEALSLTGSFQGLQGPIELNAFGDVMRKHFLMTIRNGTFMLAKE